MDSKNKCFRQIHNIQISNNIVNTTTMIFKLMSYFLILKQQFIIIVKYSFCINDMYEIVCVIPIIWLTYYDENIINFQWFWDNFW